MQAGVNTLHISGLALRLHAKHTQWDVLKAAYSSNLLAVKPSQTVLPVLKAAAAQHS
jgi:hypothetical protein